MSAESGDDDPELAEAIRLSLIDSKAEQINRDAQDVGLQQTLRLSMSDQAGSSENRAPSEVEEVFPSANEYAEAMAQLYQAGLTPTYDLSMTLEKVGGGDEQSWIESPECKRMRSNSLVLDSEGPRFDPGEMHFSEISAGLADELWDVFFGPGPVPGEGCTKDDVQRWMHQPLTAWWAVEEGDHRETLPFIVQQGGGPCGVLAALEGFLLRYLIFPDHGEGPVENFESISAEARTGALIDSMATMMTRCKSPEGSDGYICILVGSNSIDGSGGPPTMWRRSMETIEEYQKLLIQYTEPLLSSPTAVVSFVLSLILTRGGPAVCRSDMDDPSSVLVGMFGHCSQELVNLCLLGRCVSNVFDGEESMGGGMMLRGVPVEVPVVVGYITELEALRYVTVGSQYKNPLLPFWVIGSPNHYTLLYSRNINCVKRNPVSVVKDKLKDAFDANCTDEGIATVEQMDKMIAIDLPDELIPQGVSREEILAMVKKEALEGSIVLYDTFQSIFCKALFGESKLEELETSLSRPSAYSLYLYDGQKPGGPSLSEIKVVTTSIDGNYAVADNSESLQRTIHTRWPNAIVEIRPSVRKSQSS